MTSADAYDALPYTDHAYAETHPDRLVVVARLSGWDAPRLEGARVLEIGCARGGNLLPMAASMPDARFVGLDPSRAQIDEARRIARETGIANAWFEAITADALDAGEERFDFVITHGVWSWIGVEARRALLAAIGARLAPSGVAYVSFNALPGWYAKLAARDWARFASGAFGEAPQAAIDWLRARVAKGVPARAALDAVASRLGETDRAYHVHELLAPEHHAEHVTTFLDEARRAGLAYLGDAIPQDVALELAHPDVAARAEALDVARAQQLVDFARDAAFRRAVLVRADTAARGWTWPKRLDAAAIATLASTPRDDVRVEGAIDASDPRELLDLWLAGALDLRARPARCVTAASARPVACPVARWHAANGGAITNRLHQEVELPDRVARSLLARLDGSRSPGDLARELAAGAEGVAEADARRVVEAALAGFARVALLVE